MEAAETQPVLDVRVLESDAAAVEVAREIAALIREKPDTVLALATGRSPRGVYAELARLHREEGLDFARIRSFHLDEYRGLGAGDPHSFHAFLREHLWRHVNADPARLSAPDGRIAPDELSAHCAAYEQAIFAAGGLDLVLLGLGRNGHVAFNEPGARRASRTHVALLAAATRADAAAEFGGLANVPTHALTMGIATILAARRVRVLAFGAAKAAAVRNTVHGPIGPACPASFLRGHPDVQLYVDSAAAP